MREKLLNNLKIEFEGCHADPGYTTSFVYGKTKDEVVDCLLKLLMLDGDLTPESFIDLTINGNEISFIIWGEPNLKHYTQWLSNELDCYVSAIHEWMGNKAYIAKAGYKALLFKDFYIKDMSVNGNKEDEYIEFLFKANSIDTDETILEIDASCWDAQSFSFRNITTLVILPEIKLLLEAA